MNLQDKKRLLLPAIAVVGIGFGIVFSLARHDAPSTLEPKHLPVTSGFTDAISGSGLVEANTRNISVGSNLPGIVTELLVTEGQLVVAGQPLFKLDDRSARSELVTQENDMATVVAQLEEARVALADQQDQLKRTQGLKEGVVVTVDRVNRLRYATRTAAARLEVMRASLEAAKARVEAAKTAIEKLTVTAPIDGRIFKINIRPGEFVDTGPNATVPIVMGNDTPLYVRVTIDENDLWRFRQTAKVTGALRSNREVKFPLRFVRVEPYVMPKTSLTGSTSERVDTRVLEVIYSIDATDTPVYIGQQVDVFISAEQGDKAEESPPQPASLPTPE